MAYQIIIIHLDLVTCVETNKCTAKIGGNLLLRLMKKHLLATGFCLGVIYSDALKIARLALRSRL